MVGTKQGVTLSGGELAAREVERRTRSGKGKTNHKAGKKSLNLLSMAFTFKDREHLHSRTQFMEMKMSAIC
jgi:hypothetical protein